MSDFSTNDIFLSYNSGSDAVPNWSGTQINFAGSGGANELRFCASGAGGATTPSANWPYFNRPTSGTAAVPELWAFSTNTSGVKVTTYDGTNGKANVLRWQWGTSGTMTTAPQFGLFADSTRTAPSPGTQPPGANNDAISNGHTTDTSSTSYLKAAAYGSTSTANLTSGAVGSAPSATTGAAGVTTPGAGAWSAWTSLQGFIQYLQLNSTPAATTAGAWNWTCALFTGVNMSTGAITPSLVLQYTYS